VLLARRPLACDEIVELVSGYVEGTLSRGERRRFERHLAGCPNCTEYLAQMRETIRLTGRLVPADLSPQMREEFGVLFRRWRDDGDDSGGRRGGAARDPRDPRASDS
jgi:anti-sigma factor RsiW